MILFSKNSLIPKMSVKLSHYVNMELSLWYAITFYAITCNIFNIIFVYSFSNIIIIKSINALLYQLDIIILAIIWYYTLIKYFYPFIQNCCCHCLLSDAIMLSWYKYHMRSQYHSIIVSLYQFGSSSVSHVACCDSGDTFTN